MTTKPQKTEEKKSNDLPTLTVKTGTFLGSQYAQIVGVVVTDNDLTLEFVYLNPRPEIKEAQVVSRVTIPRVAGEGLAKSIVDTIRKHEDKKKEAKNG